MYRTAAARSTGVELGGDRRRRRDLAGTGAAVVELHRPPGGGIRVDIVDDGPGFDPAAVDPDRFGVRVSIGARMRRAGGSAEIVSAPGHGTRVTLRWPAPDSPEPDHPETSHGPR